MDTLLALIIGLVLGISFVIWDHKKGQKWYKRWFDLTHKDRLEAGKDVTFIRNQPFSKRLVPAIFITAIFMYVTWWLGNLNPLITMLHGAIALVAVVAGFYIGPYIANKLPKGLAKANETLKKIDELEADLSAKDVPTKTIEPERAKKVEPKTPDKKDDDWRSGVKDFLDK
ncbi:MAG: hypothetical protein ACI9JN_001111 [Bacteroidia bacterium]|jgi:hypothetical protein